MKYAIVDGQRCEAVPRLQASCPTCGAVVIGKCGEQRVWHWAHRGKRECDPWWESETEWHRNWKGEFPAEWQEFVQRALDGEKHVADVKTSHGCVIEFQHSHLSPDERRSREAFYKQMVWVVDGARLKNSGPQFFRAIELATPILTPPLRFLLRPQGSALLKTWVESTVSVFLDFGDADEWISCFGAPILWRIDRKSTQAQALVTPVPRAEFVRAFRLGERCNGFSMPVRAPAILPPPPAHGYRRSGARYPARKPRGFRRF